MMQKKWSDLTPRQKQAVVVAGTFETVLTVATLRDLAKRSPAEIRGPKAAWVLASFVQPFGPIAYFAFARR